MQNASHLWTTVVQYCLPVKSKAPENAELLERQWK